jgi:hypothetical protein
MRDDARQLTWPQRRPDDGRGYTASPVVGATDLRARYDTAIYAVRCVVCPDAVFTLRPRADEAHALELARIERCWTAAASDHERAETVLDAELLAHRLAPRNAVVEVKMPAEILAEMQTTDTVIMQLDKDIAASPKVDAPFKAAWDGFRREWSNFYKSHQGWIDRLWYGSYEKTVEYRTRALAWRRDFEAKGGKATGPADAPPKAAGEIPWKKIAIAAGALAAIGVGARVVLGRR